MAWVSELPWPAGMQNGVWNSEIDAIEDLQHSLVLFQDNGLWALIESLTIYLNAPLLRNGVVLVDLPGYHDSNFARVRVARETQAKCDDLLVVIPIARAIDCSILHSVVEANKSRPDIEMLKLQTVTVVCTHSAVLDKNLEHLANHTAMLAAKARLKHLEGREDATNKEVRQAKEQKDALIMKGRNTKVITEINNKYRDLLPKGNFHVHCVDNEVYMNDANRADLSGIPQFQEHIACLPGKTLFKLYYNFIGPEHEVTLYSFENWVVSCRLPVGMIKAVLPPPLALWEYHSNLTSWKDNVSNMFVNLVVYPIRESDDKTFAAGEENSVIMGPSTSQLRPQYLSTRGNQSHWKGRLPRLESRTYEYIQCSHEGELVRVQHCLGIWYSRFGRSNKQRLSTISRTMQEARRARVIPTYAPIKTADPG